MKLYLDTSVFGGFFDEEFKEITRILFKEIDEGNHQIVISNLTIEELATAPAGIRDLIEIIPDRYKEFVGMDEGIKFMANKYIEENVVSKKYLFDALHIALASFNRVDVLVSWNFKHMVNLNRIRQYNSVNFKYGYPVIDIRTPREVINEK